MSYIRCPVGHMIMTSGVPQYGKFYLTSDEGFDKIVEDMVEIDGDNLEKIDKAEIILDKLTEICYVCPDCERLFFPETGGKFKDKVYIVENSVST